VNHVRCRAALLLAAALPLLALLVACGGRSGDSLNDASDTEGCFPSGCASNEVWNPASCACESADGGQPQVEADATTLCPPIVCPSGSVQGMKGGECACVAVDAGVLDATHPPPADASPDSPYLDAPYYDVTYPHDVAYPTDIPPTDAYYYPGDGGCAPDACGPGYDATSCRCVACTNVCPSGQTPAAGCGGCTACPYKCPAGFDYGSGCNCGPPGTDAGPDRVDAGDAGGVTCLLEGYNACTAGSWCELGVCPDGKTQYGCYCNADGTANCQLTCPTPPSCTIPGQGICPYGAQCVFDACTGDAAATALVCSCNSGGNAYCYTSPCNDGGIVGNVDAGDAGGVTCLLEGYYTCSAGSWCELGVCPDGTTQYGCYCNADGTATCDLTCPPPPPCTIPGEGTCAYGTSCVFGSCAGNVGTLLSCYCYGSGSASCSTVPCGIDGGRD
jgi:hypothetical protein